jgi:hypothetical protein
LGKGVIYLRITPSTVQAIHAELRRVLEIHSDPISVRPSWSWNLGGTAFEGLTRSKGLSFETSCPIRVGRYYPQRRISITVRSHCAHEHSRLRHRSDRTRLAILT